MKRVNTEEIATPPGRNRLVTMGRYKTWLSSAIRHGMLWLCASCSAPSLAQTLPLPDEDTNIVGDVRVIIAHQNDTLLDIARRFDLGYDEVVAANPQVDPWLPKEGSRIVLPTRYILPDAPRKGIVVNIAAMRLFYFPAGKHAVITYPVGIGRDGWVTPTGATTVIGKTKDPAWFVPASVRAEHAKDRDPLPAVVPPGRNNPLGRFELRLGLQGYLIHGTNKRYGVGMRVSHGCMRLYPEDIEKLFPKVPIGTPVRIIDQPYLAAWENGVLYVQAYPPLAEDGVSLETDRTPVVNAVIHASGTAEPLTIANWQTAMDIAAHPQAVPLPVTKRDLAYQGADISLRQH